MIDQEWLETLDYLRPDGVHIKGLAGLGSEKVVLNATGRDGNELVLSTYRHLLGYHIREIPMVISNSPMYEVNRLNRKLAQLLGNDTLDEMTSEYDRLFSAVLRILYNACTQNSESKAKMCPWWSQRFRCPWHPRSPMPCSFCLPPQ